MKKRLAVSPGVVLGIATTGGGLTLLPAGGRDGRFPGGGGGGGGGPPIPRYHKSVQDLLRAIV